MTKLFVYGVHSSCPKDLLEEEFGRCGNVTDVYITQKGFAFVTMEDQDGVDSAISKLHGTKLDGQEIKVEQARAREEGGGRGGRGGRSYGHEALDVEEEDLGEVEEREEEGHQVLAITVTRKDTWQEIALKNEEKDEVDLVVDEVEDVVEAGHVTTAMKKGTWQENVHLETDVKFGS